MPGQPTRSPLPKRLSLYIGGYPGPYYTVRLSRRTLWYEAQTVNAEPPTKEKVPVTPEGWQTFREALDAIGVWRWQEDYPNPGVCDGTSWAATLEYADRSVASGGSNNYPRAKGAPSGGASTRPFARFLEAVRALLGGREFR